MNQMSLYQTNSLIEHEKLRAFVELVSNGPRPDGTYNYCREALQQRATLLLKELKQSREEVMETILCHKNENFVGKVIFDEGCFLTWINKNDIRGIWSGEDIEVVGNMYETPELLNQLGVIETTK